MEDIAFTTIEDYSYYLGSDFMYYQDYNYDTQDNIFIKEAISRMEYLDCYKNDYNFFSEFMQYELYRDLITVIDAYINRTRKVESVFEYVDKQWSNLQPSDFPGMDLTTVQNWIIDYNNYESMLLDWIQGYKSILLRRKNKILNMALDNSIYNNITGKGE